MILRLRAWLIERLGGELPYDWGWGPPPEPDYYDEYGNPVYDMSKRLHAALEEHNAALAQVLDFGTREKIVVDWMAEDGS